MYIQKHTCKTYALKGPGIGNKITEYSLLNTIIDIYKYDRISTPTILTLTPYTVQQAHTCNEVIVIINS